MGRYFTILAFTLLTAKALGQGEYNFWYFGDNAGMDFNGGAPVPLTNGALSTTEGVASISDNNGNLLFYTNGLTIWNQNHLVMQNGTGLTGGTSSSQSAVIIKKPASNTIYYVFTVNEYTGSTGLQYSEVDMTLQGGLGAVTVNKNVPVVSPTCEKQTAIKHQNNIDYWIITHIEGSNAFHSYLLTSAGLTMTPVISNVGTSISGGAGIGYIKGSHDGNRLAIANRTIDNVELFDFDNTTGVLSNPIAFNNFTSPGVYGVEFSPNNNFLYISEGSNPVSNVYQYNLLAGTPVDIANSRVTVGVYNGWGGALQVGPDHKIYHARYTESSIGVINDPDSLGLACNYVGNGFVLGAGTTSMFGLPLTFISTSSIITAINFCEGDSTAFSTNALNFDSLLWNFGDVNSGPNNISSFVNPLHLYTDSGTFVVTLIIFDSGNNDTITTSVTIIPQPAVNLGSDTVLCQGTTYMLNAQFPGATYLWNNNSTNPVLTVSQPGIYSVAVTNACGTANDTISINYETLPVVSLGADSTLCTGDSLVLNATVANATYLWQDNSTNPAFTVTQPGIYWVEVTNMCGSVTDSINVSYITVPTPFIGNDTTLCAGATLVLNASTPNATYLWNDNSSNPFLTVNQTGTYWVQVTNSCGTSADSITVFYQQVPVVELGNDTSLCQGNNLTLTAFSQNATYLWNDNSNGSSLIVTQPGNYWVVVTNSCGSVTDTIDVSFIALPSVNIGNDTTICQGSSITLNASFPGATYLWSDNSTGSALTVNQQGDYWVSVTNICGSTVDSISVSFFNPLSVNLGNDTTLCPGESFTLDATNSNSSYTWQDNSSGPSFTVTEPGTYWVVVTDNCETKTDTIVVGPESCNVILEMPNVFTPNDDGLNDYFHPIRMEGIIQAHLHILNRWNQELFETDDINSGWSGKHKQENSAEGTYFWIVEYTDINGNTSVQKGFLNLIR